MGNYWLKYGNNVLKKNRVYLGHSDLQPFLVFQFTNSLYDPTAQSGWKDGVHWERVSTYPNCWKFTCDTNNWDSIFHDRNQITSSLLYDVDCSVIDANTTGVTNMSWLFGSLTKLTSVVPLQTASVTDMSVMFYNCRALTSLPPMDTSAVEMMYQFMAGATLISSIPQYNTSNVVNFASFAKGATNLETVPLMDTSSATDMSNAFENSGIRSLPAFNTSNVLYMREMVKNCKNLTTFPLIDTSKVGTGGTDDKDELAMYALFSGCESLESIPLIDTSHAKKLGHFCIDCKSLKHLPAFDLSSATDVYYFCYGCVNLETTAPSYNLSSCRDIFCLFYDCRKLKAIPAITVGVVNNCRSAFNKCYMAESGILDAYNALSSQATIPATHAYTFEDCGRDSTSGAQELARIPSGWK
jgi:hypothetical protein